MRMFITYPPAVLLVPAVLAMAAAPPLRAVSQDERIVASARHSYNFMTYLKDDAIEITAKDGRVTLTGTVGEDYHKALAEETVSGLPGVKQVVNQLRVTGDQPPERSDAWITMKVKAVLAFHPKVSAHDTGVTTQGGVVCLAGQARSQAQKELTAEYARAVDGVKEVHNELVVVDPQPPLKTLGARIDDASITAQVKTSLLFHKATRVLATRVSTRAGVVTLKGEVRNAEEKALVTRLAEDITGVKRVNNLMTIHQG